MQLRGRQQGSGAAAQQLGSARLDLNCSADQRDLAVIDSRCTAHHTLCTNGVLSP
jgi:hypothetical protein